MNTSDDELWKTLVMMGKMCECGKWENSSSGGKEVWGCLLCRAEIIERAGQGLGATKERMKGKLLNEFKRRRDMGEVSGSS